MQELVRFTQYTNELINNQPLYAGAILARAARLWPESPAVIFQDTIMTYKKLYEKASAISYLLQKKGLQPGDCVMILHENSIDFYTTYYGAWQAGAIVAPVNTFMTTAELEHVVHDAFHTLRMQLSSPNKRLMLRPKQATLLPLNARHKNCACSSIRQAPPDCLKGLC